MPVPVSSGQRRSCARLYECHHFRWLLKAASVRRRRTCGKRGLRLLQSDRRLTPPCPMGIALAQVAALLSAGPAFTPSLERVNLWKDKSEP